MGENVNVDRNTWIHRLDFAIFASLILMAVCIPLTESGKSVTFVCALSFWIIKMGLEKNFHLYIPTIGWFFLGWLGVVALSSLFSDCGLLKGVPDVLMYTLCFFLIVNTMKGESRVLALIWAVLLGIGLGDLLGFFEFFILGTSSDRLSIGSLGFTAAYLAMIFSLLLGLWVNVQFTSKQHIYLGIIALMSGIALGYTHTRTMWVGVVFISAVGAILYKKWVPIIAGGVLLILLGGVVSLNPHIQDRIQQLSNPLTDESFVGRFGIWEASARMFWDHPILGLGHKCFKPNSHKYRVPDNHGQGHNIFFHVAAELGSIGLAGLLTWLGAYIHFLYRMRKTLRSNLAKALWFAALGCFLTILIGGLIDSILGSEVSLFFMIISGLLIVIQRENQKVHVFQS
jgi:O-antigen ligase